MRKIEVYKRVLPSLGPIVFRNVFLLVNLVIFLVVIFLFVFGNTQAGLFLGVVFILNTIIAITQDIHARVLLEELQMLTALRVVRINKDETETLVLAEEIKKGDLLKLKLGDQVPCDGDLVFADNLEISEALITGESDSFSKKEGEKVVAGVIITSGHAKMKVEGLFKDSRLSKIAMDVKKYAANPSSIQQSTNTIIKYSGYILLLVLLFVIIRGMLLDIPKIQIVNNAGALASTLVPQGLVVVITLLFAIGAANYSKRQVLFQEINSTEKLGRIKNLCIDKTGTLTDNILVVEEMHIVTGFMEEEVRSLVYTCIVDLSDFSQTIIAVKNYLELKNKEGLLKKEVVGALPFSSWRRYGATEIKENNKLQTVFIGTPDIMLPRISNLVEKKWLEDIIEENVKAGKRVLCVAKASETGLPKNLDNVHLSVIAMFVFRNTLRPGIINTIKFLQNRGVSIRVLSGDNADTVRAVAQSVGIIGAENVVTGEQLEEWDEANFKNHAHEYAVFAQVLPEHKVKLVEAFQKDGFTAMVGDGVNDAMAMKKADLGIAMFDGVPVTRQLADVILMNNSFSDLPGAIKLADRFIRTIEINSGIYINQSLIGLFFFIIISIFGFSFPLVPLNITLINYFTVGFSGILIAYWALRPSRDTKPANDKTFLKRVMPLVFFCSIIEALGVAVIFMLSPDYLKTASSNTLVGFALMLFGFLFLILATRVYVGSISKKEKIQLFLLGIFQIFALYLILQIPFFVSFFNVTLPFPAFSFVGKTFLVFLVFGLVQYLMVKKFFLEK